MHDAFLMRRGQAAGQLRRVVDVLRNRQRSRRDSFAQRLPFEQFRDDVGRALMQTEVVDGEDARMIQSGRRPGFALETTEAVGVAANRPGQDFDGDVTAKSGVAGPVDLAHAAGTKRRRDLVGAEAGTGDQRHAMRSIKRPGNGFSKAHPCSVNGTACAQNQSKRTSLEKPAMIQTCNLSPKDGAASKHS